MKGRKKYLAKNTALFALNSIGTKLITFFLIPLYTNYLSTAEYGIIDLISTIIPIGVAIIILNINDAVMRFSLDEDANLTQIMSIGITVVAVSGIVGLIIIPVCNCFEIIMPYSIYIYGYCVFQGLYLVSSYFLRGKELLLHFAISNILLTLSVAGFNIIFLAVLDKGVEGYFVAYILSYIIASVYALVSGNIREIVKRFYINFNLMNKMVRYSILLVPNTIMWWIINASDRIMVTIFIGATGNGLYGISYKIPSILSTASTIFNQAWSYSAIHEEDSADRENVHNRMYDSLVNFMFLLTAAVMAFIKPFFKIYVAKEYYLAWKYTPFLLIGYFFMTIGTFFSTLYTINKDSKGFLLSASVGAFVNIILNMVLIPILQIYGAALATCISYIAICIYRYVDIQKYIKITVIKKNYIFSLILLFIMAGSMFLNNNIGLILLSLEFFIMIILNKYFIFELVTIFKQIIHRK